MYVPADKPVAVAAVPPDGDQEKVYPEVPPDTETVAEPLEPPLQETFVCEAAVATSAVG